MSAPAEKAATPPLDRNTRQDTAKALAIFLMIVTILYFGKEVVLPVTLALLLAFILAPLADLLMRWHLGRVPSALLGVIFALGVVVAVGSVIGAQIANLADELPQYTRTIQAKVGKVKHYTTDQLSKWADRLGPQIKLEAGPAAPEQGRQSQPQAATAAPSQPQRESPFAVVGHYIPSILSPLATIGIVFVVTIFALLQREDLRNRLIRLVGSDDLPRRSQLGDEIVGAQFQPNDPVGRLGIAGQDHQPAQEATPQPSDHRQAVELAKELIEDHDVRRPHRNPVERLFHRSAGLDREAMDAEIGRQLGGECVVVIDKQYVTGGKLLPHAMPLPW